MSWMRIVVADPKITGVQEAFWNLFSARGAPKDAAIFIGDDSPGRAAIYFSPAAAKLFGPGLAAFKGAPCANPTASEARLLAGHDSAREMLRPDR